MTMEPDPMTDLRTILAAAGPATAANVAMQALLPADLVGEARVIGCVVDTLDDNLLAVAVLLGARTSALLADVRWSPWRLVVEYDGTTWTAALEHVRNVCSARGDRRIAAYTSTELRTALVHLVGDVAWPADVRVAA